METPARFPYVFVVLCNLMRCRTGRSDLFLMSVCSFLQACALLLPFFRCSFGPHPSVAACAQLSGDLVGQLWPALTAGFIFLVGKEWQAAMGKDAATLSSVRFRFRHDRIRQVRTASQPAKGPSLRRNQRVEGHVTCRDEYPLLSNKATLRCVHVAGRLRVRRSPTGRELCTGFCYLQPLKSIILNLKSSWSKLSGLPAWFPSLSDHAL